ncbi:metallo-beta-lactamase domain protein [Mycobacterium parascrofulaceum ATCC BAA-614]|uniref:Metallo-beta-lactamase domain protein n=1 Tax=Mycobacterium parascrofulaceum ATCC BAA-614 TaxID=525368 RepID=D5P2P5_9MYCO|nr:MULTISPECIES: MBL fold metallo-hydrolase [Mycobacterium]EFG79638.1 metallo-beta-lactamase domain protein [Mycobacterium parascrofulaceum ATCC BAA-614]OCB49319.1 MBL fold metallo-hydrolase [Mycobacterium malmoense]
MRPDPVRSPTLRQCCSAATGLLWGAARPKRPDQRFLRSVADAGLPTPRRTVTVTALPQVPRSVPTAAIVEGTFTPARVDNAMTSFVVRHPEATFIVDPAVCRDVERRAIAQLPAVLRVAVRPPADTVPTITALHQLPEPPALDFALPTHAHWDHVSGLLDLPGLPVHLHRTERDWIGSGPVAPVGGVRDSLRDRPVVDYELDGPSVLTFTRSHDVFGDGSVLLVDLAGHTPGSVGVLAHTGDGWVLIAGDAAWHRLQIEKVRQKSSYPGVLVDEDRGEAFKTLPRLHLARHVVTIVPTHDHEAALGLSA